MTATTIARATPEDVDAVLARLEQSHLPVEGQREHIGTTLVAREEGRIVGSAALETHADADGVLLRSVAVSPQLRHVGLGHELTAAARQLARDLRAPAVYLLTTTAERYFAQFGFKRISRTDVPATCRLRSNSPPPVRRVRWSCG